MQQVLLTALIAIVAVGLSCNRPDPADKLLRTMSANCNAAQLSADAAAFFATNTFSGMLMGYEVPGFVSRLAWNLGRSQPAYMSVSKNRMTIELEGSFGGTGLIIYASDFEVSPLNLGRT